MAFCHGISQHSAQGYKYDDIKPVAYPEQAQASKELLYEEAVKKYLEVVGSTDDRGRACYAASLIAPNCLHDYDFWHILRKRDPNNSDRFSDK